MCKGSEMKTWLAFLGPHPMGLSEGRKVSGRGVSHLLWLHQVKEEI